MTNKLLEPLRAAWISTFPTEVDPPTLGTFVFWATRYDAKTLDQALRETAHRSEKLGDKMSSDHRAKTMSTIAARIKLAELEQQMGTEAYKCFALVNKNYEASKGTDQDCKVALDLLEILVTQGVQEFWSAYFNQPNAHLREEGESMPRRFGPDLTWDDVRKDAARPVNPTNDN